MKSDDSRIFDALSASNIEGAVQDFDKERKRLLKNEETIADSERRWIWELLQNAKDVADGKFKAKILLHDRYVQFFHNGKSFTDSDLLALISHKTSKRKQKITNSSGTYKKPTGKFGSGFVSTFLIAPKVIIESLFYDSDKDSDRSFSIELDRDIRNYHEDEQIEKDIKKSFEAWKNIVCNRNDEYQEEGGERQDFTTSFRYDLTKEGNAAIQAGIQDIKRSIGFTLAFIPELESVEIDNQIEKQKIVYSASHERSVEDNLKRTKVFQSIDGSSEEEIYKIVSIFREYKLEDSEISISLSVAFKNNEIYIDPKNPTLYCSFPLVGTEEKFKYSTVINSAGFYPLEHRNDIPLGSEQATEGPRNRQIFEILVPLYEKLLHQIAKEKIKNLYLLANFELTKRGDTWIEEWYRPKIEKPIAELLCSYPILTVDDAGGVISFESGGLVPYIEDSILLEDFYDLALPLNSGYFPSKDYLHDWHDLSIKNTWLNKYKYTLNRFISDIAKCKSLEFLSKRLSRSEDEAIDWLNAVYDLIFRYKKEGKDGSIDIYKDEAILPNQNGEFELGQELHYDQEIPEPIKDVLKMFEDDWREKLLDKRIKSVVLKTSALGIKNAARSIDDILMPITKNKIEGFFYLYSLIPDAKRSNSEDKGLGHRRRNYWDYYKTFRPDKGPNKFTIISDWDELIWEKCDDIFIKSMAGFPTKNGNLSLKGLESELKKELEELIPWYDNFIDLIGYYKSEIFDNAYDDGNGTRLYPLFPSQSGYFKPRKDLKNDGGIPEKLKEISRILGLEEWNDKLLDKRFSKAERFIKDTAEVKDIATEIDRCIKQRATNGSMENLNEVVPLLLAWSQESAENGRVITDYFTYFDAHKPELLLKVCDSAGTRACIYDVLQVKDVGKQEAIAKIAKDEKINKEDLETLQAIKSEEEPEKQKELLGKLGIDLERLQLAPVTRVAKTQVYESVVYSDDGTTDPEKAKEIGDWGEKKAKQFLEEQGYEAVDTDAYCSYDLEYKESNGQKIKVEVKTISNGRPNIRLTVGEWKEMISSGENYELIICVHEKRNLQKNIHIRALWSTLQDRIKQLHAQIETDYQYGSQKIELCLGLQLNEKEANNHILLNWHRLFQNVEHPHITEHRV